MVDSLYTPAQAAIVNSGQQVSNPVSLNRQRCVGLWVPLIDSCDNLQLQVAFELEANSADYLTLRTPASNEIWTWPVVDGFAAVPIDVDVAVFPSLRVNLSAPQTDVRSIMVVSKVYT